MKWSIFIGKRAVLLFLLIISLTLAVWSFLTVNNFPGHRGLNSLLLERLVHIKPLPDDFDQAYQKRKRIIYVLGGAEKSVTHRYKTAADLYKSFVARKIFILSRSGITEYDPSLGRNLTNDEWAIKRLEELGIQKENIEPLSVKYGFFGTLAEARGVSQEVMSRGDDVLILVSSSYHTARVRETFSKYLTDKKISVFIYGSDDHPPLWGLLVEYFKLMLYKYILL